MRPPRPGTPTDEVPVLIVGGGPTGLTTSLALGRHGVGNLLVERHLGTSVLPRATVVSVRSMEILRCLGVEAEVRRAAVDTRSTDFLVLTESLAATPQHVIPPLRGDIGDASPSGVANCAQDVLEPLLVAAIEASPSSELRFGVELTEFSATAGGVEAAIVDRRTGARRRVRARHLVAADGAHSGIRSRLGIGMAGREGLGRYLNVLFRADIDRAVRPRPAVLYRIVGAGVNGMLRRTDRGSRWLLGTPWIEGATPDRCVELVREAVGIRDLAVEILSVGEWEAAGMLADRFRAGDVFLVGDAAHRTTPAGGLGMNTGIQEAHNLAWKLAAVCRGWGKRDLLDSYEEERRPAASAVVEESVRLFVDGGRDVSRTLGLALGHRYDRGALVPDGTEPPRVEDPVTTYVPCARPGHRAPHLWLDDGRRRSALDLFGDGLVLLTARTQAWRAAAEHTSSRGLPLTLHGVRDPRWLPLYGVSASGAVLVRPDGYVAARWRDRPERQAEALVEALRACGVALPSPRPPSARVRLSGDLLPSGIHR